MDAARPYSYSKVNERPPLSDLTTYILSLKRK